MLINPHHAQNITIEGLHLTGELLDAETMTMDLAGWRSKTQFFKNLQSFPAGLIHIKNSTLDLLTKAFGGIHLEYDAFITMQRSGNVEFKVQTNTTQSKLAFYSNTKGNMSPSANITLETKIEGLSADIPNIKVRRGAGRIETRYELHNQNSQAHLNSEFQIGSVRWHGLPLKSVSAIIQDNNTYRLSGQTYGTDNIKWHTEISYAENDTHTALNITPNTLKDLIQYLEHNKNFTINSTIPNALLNIKNPAIQIKNTENSKGEVSGMANIRIENPALTLLTEYHSTPLAQDIVGTLKLNKKDISLASLSKEGKEDTSTNFDLSIFGEFTLKDYATKPDLDWFIHYDVSSGLLDFDAIKIPEINGSITLGGNSKIDDDRKSLPFNLPLKDHIKHKGGITLNLNEIETSIIEDLHVNIYDGQLTIPEPISESGVIHKKNTLVVSDLNIERLIADAGFENISATGMLGGVIPFEASKEQIQVNGALLQTQDVGILKLPEDMINGLFPGNSSKMRNIRDALSNYHYEFFEVRLDGDLKDRVMMTVNASGKNPDMTSNDPVELHLQIETQISLLFDSLIKKEP